MIIRKLTLTFLFPDETMRSVEKRSENWPPEERFLLPTAEAIAAFVSARAEKAAAATEPVVGDVASPNLPRWAPATPTEAGKEAAKVVLDTPPVDRDSRPPRDDELRW